MNDAPQLLEIDMKRSSSPAANVKANGNGSSHHADDVDYNVFIAAVGYMKAKNVRLAVMHALVNSVQPQRVA